MALCPGFTRTEFHERMDVGRGSAPASCGSTPTTWSPRRSTDFDKGRTYSIPGAQYKAIATASRLVPNSLLQRFQSIGRR